MKTLKGLVAMFRVLYILARHADKLPTDAQLRAAGVEPDPTPYIPPWAFRGINRPSHHHRHHHW